VLVVELVGRAARLAALPVPQHLPAAGARTPAVLNAAATAVAGLIVALVVRKDGQVAAILGVAQALLALAIGFGLDLSAERQAVVMSVVGAVAAAFIRSQVVAPVSADGVKQL
jgi:hypothetical protein